MRPLTITTGLLAVALAAGGCDAPGTTTRATADPFTASGIKAWVNRDPASPADGRPAVTGVLHMDVYLVDVPAGTISRDEAFWRTVDENAVGVSAGRRLGENAIRCGVAPRRQWPRFADLVAGQLSHSRRTKTSTAGVTDRTPQSVELALDQPVDHENVYVVTPDGQLEGRTYDDAINGLMMTFGPTPRTAASVRLSFCPTVKRDYRRMGFTPLNGEFETPRSDTVRIYDAGLTVDVKPDEFFIVAPGPLADDDPDTLGGRFLVRRDPAALTEQVILAVPTVVPVSSPSAER